MSRRTREFHGHIGRTVAQSEPWWPPRQPADGRRRPNVVVILLDDMGFSDVGCFGSEIPTPAIDALAERGTRFSNFHVTPLCSPTRASLLTGLNHHKAGYAFVANTDFGVPNRYSSFPEDAVTLPEVMHDNGYATFAVGKWHLVPESEMHDGGSREMWPLQVGFDRFYGFLDAFTNLHQPHRLICDNSPIQVDEYPEGYYLTDDLTDQAISMIKSNRANDPERPFFLYLAHGAAHGPLHAKKEDIDRFRDLYQQGWDRVQEARFARQQELGLFPGDTAMADRGREPGSEVAFWADLEAADQELFARMMAVYAAVIAGVDDSTARLVSTLEQLGELDDTVIVFLSDNGATGEGGPNGTLQYVKLAPLMQVEPEDRSDVDLESLGGPQSLMHYPRGWAMASNTPFRLYKAATHEGGVRSPLIVSWPGAPGAAGGAISGNYQYVSDLLPTVLDLVGIAPPAERGSRTLQPLDGVSFAAAVLDPAGPGTRAEQHEEILGHRSFYRDGWKAVTRHRPMTHFEDDTWQLYHLAVDPGETTDLAGEHPERVAELRAAWEQAAEQHGVFPLDEGSGLMLTQRDPAESRFIEPVVLLPGTPTLERFRSNRLIQHRSFVVDLAFAWDGDAGVLVAHGGQGGGYMVYVEDGEVRLAWNAFGKLHDLSGGALTRGEQSIQLDVEATGQGRWTARLIGGPDEVVLKDLFSFVAFAPVEGIDVGADRRSPVSWPLRERHGSFPYSGVIHSVTYSPGELAPDAPGRRIEAMRAAGLRFQ
jgi:arylsulfatase A-like enzyme